MAVPPRAGGVIHPRECSLQNWATAQVHAWSFGLVFSTDPDNSIASSNLRRRIRLCANHSGCGASSQGGTTMLRPPRSVVNSTTPAAGCGCCSLCHVTYLH